MSKLGLVMVLILMAGKNYAQDYTASNPSSQASNTTSQNYFVLIQSAGDQAFYVRLDSQLYSSSPGGHLILSRLKDSTYKITVGYPGQAFPEQRFQFSIHQKDQVFQLKYEDPRGWGLYDGQGQELQKIADERANDRPMVAGVKKDDAFSRLMAEVVKDTAVMYSTYAMADSTPSAPPTAASSIPSPNTTARDSAAMPPAVATSSSVGADTAASGLVAIPVSSSLHPDSLASVTSPFHPDSTVSIISSSHPDSAAATSMATHLKPSRLDTATTSSASRPDSTAPTTLPVQPGVSRPDTTTAGSAAVPANADSAASGTTAPRITPSAIPPAASPATATSPGTALPSTTTSSGSVIPSATGSPVSPVLPATAPSSGTALPLPITGSPISPASPLYKPSAVVKLSERKSSQALRLVYADHPANKKTDTIVVIIPIDSSTITAGKPAYSPVRPARASDTTHASLPAGLPFVNSDCHSFATDYDVDKLRVKMLETGKDDDRILTARKFFKTKCFSTAQIKSLSEVFTSDAAKFKFLEAAYPFVSDDRFPELVSLLADPVYSGRFRAMTDRH